MASLTELSLTQDCFNASTVCSVKYLFICYAVSPGSTQNTAQVRDVPCFQGFGVTHVQSQRFTTIEKS